MTLTPVAERLEVELSLAVLMNKSVPTGYRIPISLIQPVCKSLTLSITVFNVWKFYNLLLFLTNTLLYTKALTSDITDYFNLYTGELGKQRGTGGTLVPFSKQNTISF